MRPPRLMRSVGRTEQPYMSESTLEPKRDPIQKAAVLAAAVLAAGLSWIAYRFYQHGKLDLNGARVWAIAHLLEIERPASFQGETLEQFLQQRSMSTDLALDAWGRPLAVEIRVGQ